VKYSTNASESVSGSVPSKKKENPFSVAAVDLFAADAVDSVISKENSFANWVPPPSSPSLPPESQATSVTESRRASRRELYE
jgi:hypothetical protein